VSALFISDETAAMSRQDVRRLLFTSGWQFLDGGSFSSVWKAPDGSRVIKVTKPDRGSDATTAASRANPDNPWLPNIFATSRLACGGSMTEVELLEPCEYDRNFKDVDKVVQSFENDATVTAPHKPLLEALVALDKEADRLDLTDNRWDCGVRNVMIRQSASGVKQIVLTDLLYDKETLIFGAGWDKGTAHDAASVAKPVEAVLADAS
jgi:hypothetical protein